MSGHHDLFHAVHVGDGVKYGVKMVLMLMLMLIAMLIADGDSDC